MPPRGRKRKSDQSVASDADSAPIPTATVQTVATKTASSEESPRKRPRMGVTAAQKQALIDNLQLEVTERARKLRAQYHLQAQGLRTRIEIRVNRIPMALRKLRMGDLLQKHTGDPQQQQRRPATASLTTATTRIPPPVPEKDAHPAPSMAVRGGSSPRAHAVSRPAKRLSDHLDGGDKENQSAHLDNPKKRARGGHATTHHATQPGQVLSPASSNSRLNPATTSPTKPPVARPMSPTKPAAAAAATDMLSSMVEKARATRGAMMRKPTASSIASSAAGASGRTTAARTRGRAAAASSRTATTTAAAATAAASRDAKRISGISESSDASAATVVRKVGRPAGRTAASTTRKVTGTATAAAAPKTKRTVMSSIKKGVAGAATRKTTATKTATAIATTTTTTASATSRSGRVLRKRD